MINQSLSQDGPARESPALQRFLRYGPLLFWMAFILFASTNEFSAVNTSKIIRPVILWLLPNVSETQLATIHFSIRKLAHFLEYGLLAFLAGRAFVTSSVGAFRQHWFLLGILLVSLYALMDEYHQSFLSSRSGSLYDSAIDVVGGLTVLLIFRAYHRDAEEPGAAGNGNADHE